MSAAKRSWQRDLPSAAVLWPDDTRRMTYRPSVRRGSLLVLPSRRSPRMLVPADVPTAARMLRRHSTSRHQRIAQELLALGQRTGALRFLPLPRLVPIGAPGAVGDSVEELVRRHIPGATRVGVLLGPPRANAKPVLQVFNATGHTLAFGKLGHDAHAGALVAHEAEVLNDLGAHRLVGVEVPTVLWAGSWQGLEVLLMSPMRSSQRRASTWQVPLTAMREVALLGGVERRLTGANGYVRDLASRVDTVTHPAGTDDLSTPVLQRILSDCGRVEVAFGRWHGDWAPWNMGVSSRTVQLWDWERSRTGIPLGFDVIHFLLQRHFRGGTTAAGALTSILEEAGRSLADWYPGGGPDDEQVTLTVLLYLLEISCRYRADAGGTPNARLQARLQIIEAMTSSIAADLPRGSRAHA